MKKTSHRLKAVEDVANSYKAEGYQVKVYPSAVDLPQFLKPYKPELLVTNGREKVVVEVKTRRESLDRRSS